LTDKVVLIVEDDLGLRRAISRILKSEAYNVVEFSTGERLLNWLDCAVEPPSIGCVLLDVDLPGMSGISVQQKVLKQYPGYRSVFMSGAADAGDVNAAWKNGAWDFLLKPFDLEELLATIVAVFDVRTTSNPTVRNTTRSEPADLTPRERQVVSRVAAGRLNKQIAEELGLSLRTIKMHRGNAMYKLGFSHVAELVRYIDKND